jgi:drug/metabolite transporter (DMT)-like permease
MLAYALVLTSAFLHAAWNALVKRTRDPSAAVHAVVATAGVLTAIAAAIEWQWRGTGVTLDALGLAALAGVLEAGYFHALGRALSIAPLGPVYTVSRGGAAVLVWPLSMLLLGERLTTAGAIGSALIIAGLAAAGLSTAISRRAVIAAGSCAAFIAGYNLTYKHALNTGSSPLLVFAVSMVVATALGALLGGVRYRTSFVDSVRAQPWSTLGAGAVCATAFVLFMFGLAEGGAAYVFTLRNTSVLWATALGMLLGERPSRASLLGVALVFAGACALAFAK